MSKSCYICGAPVYKFDLCGNCYTATSEYQFTNESFLGAVHLRKEYFALLENIKKNPKNIFIEYLYELEAMAKVMRFRFYEDELDRRVRNDILDIRVNFKIKAPRGIPVASLSGEKGSSENEELYRYPAEDGHLLKNRNEVTIDNWLYHQLVVHAFGKKVYLSSTPDQELRCGFFLPEVNLYIEYFDTLEESEERRNIYKANRLNLILVDKEQVEKINESMPSLLKLYFPTRSFF